eukprot:437228_1
MWGDQSKDHQSNPFTKQKFEIKGLDNLNPFSKKKRKKEKFSIRVVDDKSKKKKGSGSQKRSTKPKSASKKRSTKPKSTPKKATHSKKSSVKKMTKSKSYDTQKSSKPTHKTKGQSSSISTQRCITPSTRKVQHNKSQSVHKRPKQKRQTHTQQPPAQQQYEDSDEDEPPPATHYVPKRKPKTRAKPKTTQRNYQSKRTASPEQNTKPSRPKQKHVTTQNNRHKKTTAAKPIRKKKATSSRKYQRESEPQTSSKSNKKKKRKKKKKNVSDSEEDEDDEEDKHKKKKKNRQNQQDSEFRSRLEADIIDEKPDICFRDVQGLEAVKLALYETIILPSLRPELFTGLRAPTSGLLLFGPPGNGKTMIAKCVAAECDGTFFSISASSITSKFVGDAERIMRTLFDLARDRAPSIIFIDEIDSLLTARGGQNEAESSRRIKTEFLIQFDGVKKASDAAKRVLVIGATNLPNQLDEAVLRRFGKRIMVPLPDEDTRKGLLTLLMAKQKTNLTDDDFMHVVMKTKGYSCSDLSTLCKDASMGPIRDLGAKIIQIQNESDMPFIETKHFDAALDNVKPSLPQSSLKYFIEWNDKYGSKIHLSLSALPDNMKPYTDEELRIMSEKANATDEEEEDEYEDDEKSD